MVVRLSHSWIKAMLVARLPTCVLIVYEGALAPAKSLEPSLNSETHTHTHTHTRCQKLRRVHTHAHPPFLWKMLHHNWQPTLFGRASPALQLGNMTPSVYWVLFVWCCLTSAREESTPPLLRWYVRNVLEELSRSVQEVAMSQGDVINRSGEALSGVTVCFYGVDRSLQLRCDRCDTCETEQYLAPRGQVELDSAEPSPPGQDQVLSLRMCAVGTLIPALTLY